MTNEIKGSRRRLPVQRNASGLVTFESYCWKISRLTRLSSVTASASVHFMRSSTSRDVDDVECDVENGFGRHAVKHGRLPDKIFWIAGRRHPHHGPNGLPHERAFQARGLQLGYWWRPAGLMKALARFR